MAFWDTSAIVPLCCSQQATRHGRTLVRDLGRMIVWWGTPVEARSAFARLLPEGRLADSGLAPAITLLDQLRASWDEIQPSPKVRSLSEQLPDDYGVRSADALQLAAALVWCGERPRRRPFICFDERLATAATAVGFVVRR